MDSFVVMQAEKGFINLLREAIQHNKGEVFFADDFLHLGELSKIQRGLSLLVKRQEIRRISKGIYYLPIIDELIGLLVPSIDDIVQKIAQRDQIMIRPTGADALNRLGFSTQVPMRFVYLTSGPSRQIKIGKGFITLKHRNPKYMGAKDPMVYLIIQALIEIGDYIKKNKKLKEHLVKILNLVPSYIVRQDAVFAPVWITRLLLSTIKRIELKNEALSKS